MAQQDDEIRALGERVDAMRRFGEEQFEHARAGDISRSEDQFASDCDVWRLMDDVTLPASRHMAEYYRSMQGYTNIRREDVSIHAFPDGYFVRAEIRATAPDGSEFNSGRFLCLLFVKDGKVTHIEEYAGPWHESWWRAESTPQAR